MTGSDEGVESNSRLTAGAAALLFVLLAIEGVTVLRVRQLLSVHVFVGMMLVPPVLLKIGSTGWRFVGYYRRSPPYRRKGPPPWLLRVLGVPVVALTVVLLASGIWLVVFPGTWHAPMLTLHKASFVAWFAAMTIHVLGHLRETVRLAAADWTRRGAAALSRAGARRALLVMSLVAGCALGLLMLGPASDYHPHRQSVQVPSGHRPI